MLTTIIFNCIFRDTKYCVSTIEKKMKTLLFFIPVFFVFCSSAQTTIRQDETIKQMVDDVSSKNIEAIIRKLVTFKSRHTLSDTTSTTEGSGAARNWIKAEYERYAKESGGRMTVQFDTFTQPKGTRIDKPVKLKNVLAILKGTIRKIPGFILCQVIMIPG